MAARKKKSSWKPFVIAIAALVIIAVLVFLNTDKVEIDASQYAYTDSEVQDENAEHTIIEYADFQCPYCAQTSPVLKQLREDYDARIEYKHFPLSQIHPYAQSAAEASECARDQNRFWAYHDVLFDNQPNFADNYLYDYAEALELDMDAWSTCFENREKQITVTQDYQDGVDAGVTGTPTIFIDGEQVEARSYAAMAAYLE